VNHANYAGARDNILSFIPDAVPTQNAKLKTVSELLRT
jgi:hypothetical protein